MRVVFDTYEAGGDIPALSHLKDRKLAKYLNRETMAAIAAVGKLHALEPFPPDTPFYYATGMLEYEDYGLDAIVADSLDGEGRFSLERYLAEGIAAVSPLNQFKVLQNMPLSFASITFGLKGDNAVLYSGAGALVRQALSSPHPGELLLGVGKAWRDGRVECGFARTRRDTLADSPWLGSEAEGIEMFRSWSGRAEA